MPYNTTYTDSILHVYIECQISTLYTDVQIAEERLARGQDGGKLQQETVS